MTGGETFQIPSSAAETYESRFVPALFTEWAELVVEQATVRPGQAVLDVACGTGIVARTAADRLGDDGLVVGVDLNEAMLTVARRIRPDVEWQQGDALALPLPDRAFDVVLCQMALMFVTDRVAALREMARVARGGATVAVVVPAALDVQPGYRPFVEMAEGHVGPAARSMLHTYWNCGDPAELTGWFRSAGLQVTGTTTHLASARFASVPEFVGTEIESTPMMGLIDEATLARIVTGAHDVLRPFTAADGSVDLGLRGHIVTAARTQ